MQFIRVFLQSYAQYTPLYLSIGPNSQFLKTTTTKSPISNTRRHTELKPVAALLEIRTQGKVNGADSS